MSNGQWAKTDTEIASTFAQHLSDVFTPFTKSYSTPTSEDELVSNAVTPPPLFPAIAKVTKKEVQKVIKSFKLNKAPGLDLITAKILKELPPKGISFITAIFNTIFRIQHFPILWKIAQVILMPKPGKIL